jgi:hypothetical protein
MGWFDSICADGLLLYVGCLTWYDMWRPDQCVGLRYTASAHTRPTSVLVSWSSSLTGPFGSIHFREIKIHSIK